MEANAVSSHPWSHPAAPLKESSYGVQSLEETVIPPLAAGNEFEAAEAGHNSLPSKKRRLEKRPVPARAQSPLTARASLTKTGDPHAAQQLQPHPSALSPTSLTSSTLGSSRPNSRKTVSLKSLHHSDSESMPDDLGGQAVASSEEDDVEEAPSDLLGSAPQLVMPSIKMPSRRPFTDRGRNMGRLKLLIAGSSGMCVVA